MQFFIIIYFLRLYSLEDNLVNGTNKANEPFKDLD